MSKNKPDKNSQEYLLGQIAAGRFALMVMILWSLVNLVMILVNEQWYFLFSATIPYYLALFCKGMDNGFVEGGWPVIGGMTMAALIVGMVIMAVYILCWVVSRRREGWLKGALALFVLDCSALVLVTYLLYGSPLANVLDIMLHVWVLWSLIQAVRSYKKLQENARKAIRKDMEE